MDKLVESLMEELNCNTVFTIPLFGGIPVLESVVVTWIIMAIMMIGSLILVKGLKMRNIGKKQAALESGFTFLYRFFGDLLGEDGKAYMEEANCPDGYCEEQGKISGHTQTIVCLPHKLVVEILENENDQSFGTSDPEDVAPDTIAK